jgi:PKD repeat protein
VTPPPPSEDTIKPSANAGSDQTVNEDTVVTFDGSACSDNVGVTSYTWTFTDVSAKTLTGINPSYTFNTPGVYAVILNVEDAAGNRAADTVVVTVLGVTEPVANAGQDLETRVDAPVNFDCSSSSDNLGVVSYDWDFGDGTTGKGKTVSHKYASAGSYTVTLTVKDEAGNSATDTVFVAVYEVGAFSLWTLGAVVAVIAVVTAVAALLLWRRQKTSFEKDRLK